MPYTAQRQSLYGVGSPAYINTQPDYGHLIDSIAGSANSLVQQAYTRKLQMHEEQRRDQELQLQQDREARESAAQNRQLDIAEEGNRIRKLQAGFVPAHDEVSMETPAPQAPSPRMVNPTAMISGLPAQGGNSPLTKPVDLGTSQQPQLVTSHVDESYDPMQSAAYQRSVGIARVRAEATDEQIDRRNAGAGARQQQRDQDTAARQAAHDSRVAASKGSTKTMTPNARAQWSGKTADALLAEHGGNFEESRDWLASDDGKELRDRGLSVTDLYLAHGRATGRLTQQALPLERGIDAVSPDSAVKVVKNTAAAARQNGGSAAPRPAAAAPRPLNPREKQTAKSDPGFAKFLQSKGYKPKDWQ